MNDSSPVLTGWAMIAKYLHVHEQTAMKMFREDDLPVGKVNGNVVTTVHILERWVIKRVKLTKYKKK